jgi:hypothetical protein
LLIKYGFLNSNFILNILPRNLLRLNLIIAIIVFCLPLVIYSYLLFPKVDVIDFGFWKYELKKFSSLYILISVFVNKLYVLLFVSIWFITILNRWKNALFSVIIGVFIWFSEMFYKESNDILLSCFLGAVLLSFLILFLLRLSQKYKFHEIEKIKILFFDILNLINIGNDERQVFNNKNKITNLISIVRTDDNEKTSLYKRIQELEVFLKLSSKKSISTWINNANSSIKAGIIFVLILSPTLFFIHKIMPLDTAIIDIGAYTYDTKTSSLVVFFYLLNSKIVNIILLSIWFFTTKNIIKYGVFFNLIIAVFQLVSVLNNTSKMDESELLTALPIMIPILITFLLLHKIIKYKSKNDILNEEIEEEIQEVLTAINAMDDNKNSLVAELISLRENQAKLSKATYQQELLRIKGAIERKMQVK